MSQDAKAGPMNSSWNIFLFFLKKNIGWTNWTNVDKMRSAVNVVGIILLSHISLSIMLSPPLLQ